MDGLPTQPSMFYQTREPISESADEEFDDIAPFEDYYKPNMTATKTLQNTKKPTRYLQTYADRQEGSSMQWMVGLVSEDLALPPPVTITALIVLRYSLGLLTHGISWWGFIDGGTPATEKIYCVPFRDGASTMQDMRGILQFQLRCACILFQEVPKESCQRIPFQSNRHGSRSKTNWYGNWCWIWSRTSWESSAC